jgi:hypothetical protein
MAEARTMKGNNGMRCEVCGNVYDKSFEIRIQGETHVFDSFECAIHALAPTCSHCGCRSIAVLIVPSSMGFTNSKIVWNLEPRSSE